jgi:DNA repair photolyase
MNVRGSIANPPNRFIPLRYVAEPDCPPDEATSPRTQFLVDHSRSIIARNDSPDVGFTHSVNPYRGCEHGCAYCYARPYHEYLGFSAGLDFETKIMVKENAPELLRDEFLSPRWQPTHVAFSGITDSYQPIERSLKITRRCLEVCREFRNPVSIITKNALVTRDIDVLSDLAAINAACVFLSVTSLDAGLTGILEPRTTRPHGRLAAVTKLRDAGIPVGVMAAPMIPGVNDHELPAILEAARDAGAQFAGYTVVRLPLAVGEVFANWLQTHLPERKDKVLQRIQDAHAGRLNDTRFRKRMAGDGPLAAAIRNLFTVTTRRLGIDGKPPKLSTEHFRRPGKQPALF